MKAFIVATLLAVAAADSAPKYGAPQPSYGAPSHGPAPYKSVQAYKPAPTYKPAPAYKPAPTYKPAPAYKPAHAYKPTASYGHHEDYSAPSPYQFDYAVNDHYNGAVFSQNEQGDDYGNVQGYYSVNLPDGRVQHVKYVANDYGNNAEVTYDGEAQYPEYHPAPAYKAAPAYKPAPAYKASY